LQLSNITLLCKSLLPLPEKWHGLSDVEIRYRERYLDLIANPEVREIARKRSRMITAVRQFFDERGYVEVETPILQPIPGGASAQPFITHHNALNTDFYLRIAPELYLKRLLVGGFEKVYEISRCFRNEGIDRNHNPEFTQIEFYESYQDYEYCMKLVEQLLSQVAQAATGSVQVKHEDVELSFTPPYSRITFTEAVKKYAGVDLDRYSLGRYYTCQDSWPSPQGARYNTLHDSMLSPQGSCMQGIIPGKIPGDASLTKAAQDLGLEIEPSWGRGEIMDEIFKKKVVPQIIRPTFIYDYPIELSPLAKKKPDDPALVERFQLIINGLECANAFSELNDPLDQRERFLEQEKLRAGGLEQAQRIDEDFIKALEHGMPPATGCGIGLDRLAALLTGVHTIKEVILFPTLRPKEAR
jgi:lysyl-tRNA synthetase class 2